MNNSLSMLSDSLDLKIELLKEIENYNEMQRKAFEEERAEMMDFDKAIDEKSGLIERLEKLDEGFESLYKSLSDELNDNRQKYASEIKELQDKIRTITELSVTVQASEARNKKIIEQYFKNERKNIKQSRVGSKVAYDYYKSMSGANIRESQFLDSKK